MGCHGQNGEAIATWTTPSIRYKPSQVEINEVEEIVMTISQGGKDLIVMDKDRAAISEDGFTWLLSQEETGGIVSGRQVSIQIDYKTTSTMRYTTMPKSFSVLSSAMEGVI